MDTILSGASLWLNRGTVLGSRDGSILVTVKCDRDNLHVSEHDGLQHGEVRVTIDAILLSAKLGIICDDVQSDNGIMLSIVDGEREKMLACAHKVFFSGETIRPLNGILVGVE